METPAGQVLRGWEQQHIDAAVADIFGFHALQLGLPALEGLRDNRMPHRWLAASPVLDGDRDDAASGVALCCEFDALPFDSDSLDLVVLPHTLEFAADPHRTLNEVHRVLRPEGRVVIIGFNPASLWGVRQRLGHLRRGLGFRRRGLYLPEGGEFIAYRRLRDWLRVLNFEIEAGRFGCFRAPATSQRWLDRFIWMERWGERWWPVFGAVYALTAVKRVRGMRLVGLAREGRRQPAKAARAVAAPSAGLQQRNDKVLNEQ